MMGRVLVPRRVAEFNKVVTNRVQGVWAPYLPPWAVVVHRGRRSGREYRTPVVALLSGGRVFIALPYGADSDWVRNLLVAERGGVEYGGRLRRVVRPRVVEAEQGEDVDLPPLVRAALRRVDVLVADVEER
ncbi:nitroreductase family deazaflavin-dependent oxidoreductase [Actinomadura atramentaria]|uniref:nitroreductase family deazaflavin-dependent oxidoreductase n=1 Tax=Actinomadura atramentaria TaxID=1990 RepID=UPI001969CAE9|nr:nitroreductase family deazaflavin-dependent oxidoreductase [Actinomadura atramentaria]